MLQHISRSYWKKATVVIVLIQNIYWKATVLTFCGVLLADCRQPPHCVPETYTNATSWYKVFTTVRDSDTKYSQDYNPFWCYKGAIGKVYHTLNPKLTVIVPDVSCLSRIDESNLFSIVFICSSHILLVFILKPVFSLLAFENRLLLPVAVAFRSYQHSRFLNSELCSRIYTLCFCFSPFEKFN